MSHLLRLIGCLWIFLTIKNALAIGHRWIDFGLKGGLSLGDILSLLLLAGGIGLLLLRSWGRWLVLVGCIGLVWLKAGGPLTTLNFSQPVIKILLFYGIFIVLMLLPQSRSATR